MKRRLVNDRSVPKTRARLPARSIFTHHGKPFDPRARFSYAFAVMGRQSNKIQKRRRRIAYLERQKVKARETMTTRKSKPRRPAAKKEKAAVVVPGDAAALAKAVPAE